VKSNRRRAALVAAFVLAGCGGGGGGDPAPAPPAANPTAEQLRLAGQATMDVAALAWSLAADVQNTLVFAPSEAARTVACEGGGRTVVTRPVAGLLRIDHEACVVAGIALGVRVEAEDAIVSSGAKGTAWSGTVRMNEFSTSSGGSSPRSRTLAATGSGSVSSTSQPLTLQLSGLSARRSPSALGRDAVLGSTSLRVQRVPVSTTRDLYALEGCVTFTAPGLVAELCLDAGSRIGLIENVTDEQLSGRLRWNAGTPGGFDTRLRITPGGATGSTGLRIELDLDNNGSYETSATLDRNTDIGLRL
jgi:hypothetical protein